MGRDAFGGEVTICAGDRSETGDTEELGAARAGDGLASEVEVRAKRELGGGRTDQNLHGAGFDEETAVGEGTTQQVQRNLDGDALRGTRREGEPGEAAELLLG